MSVEQTPRAYLEELNEQVDLDRKALGRKPFDRDDEHKDGEDNGNNGSSGGSGKSGAPGTTTKMQSTTDLESGPQSREGKPDGFHYSEHRTVDSKWMVDRHVWQDALVDIIAFTRTGVGSRIYSWRKQSIERSFAEAKDNHGLRNARTLRIRNVRERCFLTAAVQNIKRLVASLSFLLSYSKPRILF